MVVDVGPLHGARADQPNNAIDPECSSWVGCHGPWKLVAPTMLETLRSSPFIKPALRLESAEPMGDRAASRGGGMARINQLRLGRKSRREIR